MTKKITIHHSNYHRICELIIPFSEWHYRSIAFAQVTSTMMLDNEITLVVCEKTPIIGFTKLHPSAPQFRTAHLAGSYQRLTSELPEYPLLGALNLSSHGTPEPSTARSLYAFSRLMEIDKISLFQVEFTGRDYWIEVEYHDERDQRHELELDVLVDIALCITLENGKSVLITVDNDRLQHQVYFGTKAAFKAAGYLRSPWLRDDNFIDWKEKRIY